MIRFFILISSLAFIGCSHSSQKSKENRRNIQKQSYKKQIQRLESSLNKQARILKQLREQNEKLRLKSFKNRSQVKATKDIKREQLKPTDFEAQTARAELGEAKLFGTFLSAHNTRRSAKANRAFYLLEKAYPNSPLLAEALYLRGKLSLEKKAYKKALGQMNRIIEDFPSHSRARSSMLAKSVIYRRLQLIQPSVSVLEELMRKYPKTEEAKKAKAHLALLKNQK